MMKGLFAALSVMCMYVCMYVCEQVSVFASSISALRTSDMAAAVICIARAFHLSCWSPPHSLALTGPPPSAPSRG